MRWAVVERLRTICPDATESMVETMLRVAAGQSGADIARALGMRRGSVNTRVCRMTDRAGLQSKTQLAAWLLTGMRPSELAREFELDPPTGNTVP